jgi:hypothetical protein
MDMVALRVKIGLRDIFRRIQKVVSMEEVTQLL